MLQLITFSGESNGNHMTLHYESAFPEDWKKHLEVSMTNRESDDNSIVSAIEEAMLPEKYQNKTWGELLKESDLTDVSALWHGDVTGDGKDDLLLCFPDEIFGSPGYSIEIYAENSDNPKMIYQCRTANIHASWQSLYMLKGNDQYYILKYNPTVWTGNLDYMLEVTKVNAAGKREQIFWEEFKMNVDEETEDDMFKKDEFEEKAQAAIDRSIIILEYGAEKVLIDGRSEEIDNKEAAQILEQVASYRKTRNDLLRNYANILGYYDVPEWREVSQLTAETAILLSKGLTETFARETVENGTGNYVLTQKEMLSCLETYTLPDWKNALLGIDSEPIAFGPVLGTDAIGEINRMEVMMNDDGTINVDLGWSQGGWQSIDVSNETFPKIITYKKSFR